MSAHLTLQHKKRRRKEQGSNTNIPTLIEHPLNRLLRPLAILPLPAHHQPQRPLYRRPIREPGLHKPDARPRRLHHLAALVMRIHARLAAAVALAPAAVGHLLGEEKVTTAPDVVAVGVRLASGSERLEREHAGVREADAPAAVPGAVGPLGAADVSEGGAGDGADGIRAVGRVVVGGEEGEGGDDGGGAFRVVVLDHDAAEDLGGVEVLEVLGAAGGLVGGEAAGGVLHGEEGVDGVAEAGVGDEGRVARGALQRDDGFEGLARAVADGVALVARAECPGAFAAVPVAEGLVGDVGADLLVVEEGERFEEHGLPVRVLGEAGVGDGLDEEGGVPCLHAVRAVHEHAFVLDP